MTEPEVLEYLRTHPDFFARHAALLGDVRVYSPHGGRAVSLQERQAEILREKIRALEYRQVDMIRYGNENAMTADKVQRWTLAMLQTSHAVDIPERIVSELKNHFSVPQIAIRLWNVRKEFAAAEFTQNVSEDTQALASSLMESYCGANADYEAARWLEKPDLASSIALLPLRQPGQAQAFGLLVLASPDPQRFHAGMGTDFLERIAAIASAALSRLF